MYDPASPSGDVISMYRLQSVGKVRDTFYMGGKKRCIFSTQGKLEKPRLWRPWRSRHHSWLSIFLDVETVMFLTLQAVSKVFSCLCPKSTCNRRLQQQSSTGLTLGNSYLCWQNCKLAQQSFTDLFLRAAVSDLEDSLSRYARLSGCCSGAGVASSTSQPGLSSWSCASLLHCSWGCPRT